MNNGFKTIPGFKNYEINALGEIYSIAHDVETKSRKASNGQCTTYFRSFKRNKCKPFKNRKYWTICAIDDSGKRKTLYIARALLEAFNTHNDSNLEVAFKDGNKDNITLDNLHWVSKSFNRQKT